LRSHSRDPLPHGVDAFCWCRVRREPRRQRSAILLAISVTLQCLEHIRHLLQVMALSPGVVEAKFVGLPLGVPAVLQEQELQPGA
jgi:hypothetical protein